jgi:hypothetical protein
MKNTKAILIAMVLLIWTGMSFADGNGGYAGAYLRLGLGARQQALGNSAVAVHQVDAYSFFYNPALSGLQEKRIFTLSHSFMSLDRRFNFIGFSAKVPPGAGMSVGWINSGVDNLYSYDMLGQKSGSIDHGFNAFYFNFARLIAHKISIGVTIKHVREGIDIGSDNYHSSGWGWDFGLAYLVNKDLIFGASLRDVGTKLTASTEKLFEFGGTTVDKFPKIFSVGAAYQTPLPWLRLQYAFERTDYMQRHHLGAELVYHKILALRFGLDQSRLTFGAGMGFKLWKFFSTLDYAFVPSVVDEGGSHVFSWQFFLD